VEAIAASRVGTAVTSRITTAAPSSPLTGIRPAIAAALIALDVTTRGITTRGITTRGITTRGITTRATLRDGLALATTLVRGRR